MFRLSLPFDLRGRDLTLFGMRQHHRIACGFERIAELHDVVVVVDVTMLRRIGTDRDQRKAGGAVHLEPDVRGHREYLHVATVRVEIMIAPFATSSLRRAMNFIMVSDEKNSPLGT